jgi:methylase of polypeptide subunit release factors
MSTVSPSFKDHMHVIRTKAYDRFYATEEELRRDFVNAVEALLQRHEITPVIEMERRIIRGRPDARIGAVAFELESPIDSRGRIKENLSESKVGQLQGYLSEIRLKENILSRGVATNGMEIVLLDEEGYIVDRGDIVEKSWALEVWLTSLVLTIMEPRDLIERLGPGSSIGRDLIITLWNSFRRHRDKIPFVKDSFEAWRGLYGCAVNLTQKVRKAVRRYASMSFNLDLKTNSDVEEFLFIVETYLSMLMKALVARTLLQRLLVPHTSVCMLLEPDYVEGFFRLEDRVPLAKNVFEADAFTWFVDISRKDRSFGRSLDAKLKGMISCVDTLDLSRVPVDLLRRMYQEFFDSALRKALGEFYTSEEIVDEILDAAGFSRSMVERWAKSSLKSHQGYILDHGCGSGTFLLRVIERIKKTTLVAEEKLKVITDKVLGIDIHPFAVAMARCNYIIAISDLVRSAEGLSVVKIPIYWADSLAMLTKKTKMEPNAEGAIADVYEASIPVLGVFYLPDPRIINLERLLVIVRKAIDQNWSKDAYADEVKRTFGEKAFLVYKEQVMDLYHKFKERKNKGLNGRWVAFLKNVFIVEELKGKCELVCSNPPWVRIHNIANEIKDNLISNYKFYDKEETGWNPKFRKTKVPFKAQFDYSMAFVEAGLRYLNERGILAFVITSKVQQTLYANVMRRNLMEYEVMRLIDYSLYPKPLFKGAVNYPLILIVKKELHPSAPETSIDVVNARKKKLSWNIKQKKLFLRRGDGGSPWLICPPKLHRVFRKIQKNLRLGDLFKVERGIEGWPNKVFIVSRVKPTATRGVVQN